MRPAAPTSGNVAMFERRTDLLRLLAVAETGTIGAAAERSNVTQPTLTRDIARLEQRFGGLLFERLPHGVRPTALGATAVERARRILAEVEAAEQAIDATRSGRTGVFRVTATPPWTETVLAHAAARFREGFPAIELRIGSATRAEGLRRLADGSCDLHCGGIDTDEPLPAFLRRERFLDMTAGIVAWRDHPLFAGTVTPEDLARYPWIDYDWPAPASLDETRPSLAAILAQLRGEGPAGIVTVLRLGAAASLPWPAAPGSPGSRRNCWNACPAVSSGRCRSNSGATATAPDSSPGARPRTCRHSGRWSRPCATRRSGGTARRQVRRAKDAWRFKSASIAPAAIRPTNRSAPDRFVEDLPAPPQDCRVAVIRAPPRAVTPRKVQCREAPAPALSSRPSPRERTDAPRATALPSGANCGQGGSAD